MLRRLLALLVATFVVAQGARLARAETADSPWWKQAAVQACCSLADALYGREIGMDGDFLVVEVEGGGPRDHAWAVIGKRYKLPRDKVKTIPGNPEGRDILFVNPHTDQAICFVGGPRS